MLVVIRNGAQRIPLQVGLVERLQVSNNRNIWIQIENAIQSCWKYIRQCQPSIGSCCQIAG